MNEGKRLALCVKVSHGNCETTCRDAFASVGYEAKCVAVRPEVKSCDLCSDGDGKKGSDEIGPQNNETQRAISPSREAKIRANGDKWSCGHNQRITRVK